MKFVILTKAKPYTRIKGGKLERVRGYPGLRKFSDPTRTMPKGIHTKKAAKELVNLLNQKFPEYKFIVMGSLAGNGKTKTKGDIDIGYSFKPTTPKEKEKIDREHSEMMEKLGRGEDISGFEVEVADPIVKLLGSWGYTLVKEMRSSKDTPIQWRDQYIDRFRREHTKHQIDFWFFELEER